MKKKKNKILTSKVVVIGAGVTAIGAGAYYLLGPKSKLHQKKTKVWMDGMVIDVEKKLKKVKAMTKPLYHEILDTLALEYGKKHKEYKNEVHTFAKKLKSEWKGVEKKVTPAIKKIKKVTKK